MMRENDTPTELCFCQRALLYQGDTALYGGLVQLCLSTMDLEPVLFGSFDVLRKFPGSLKASGRPESIMITSIKPPYSLNFYATLSKA